MSTIQTEKPDQAEESVARLTSLEIENFRAFDRLKLNNLGRVNLLVGLNNCGKTTVLEAVNLLMADDKAGGLWSVLARRGEQVAIRPPAEWPISGARIDIRRLFRGHKIDSGTSFSLRAYTDGGPVEMTARIEDFPHVSPSIPTPFIETPEDLPSGHGLSLYWSLGPNEEPREIRNIEINRRGGVSVQSIARRATHFYWLEPWHISFFTPLTLNAASAAAQLDRIVLKPEESLVVEVLRIIEPDIERIASVADASYFLQHGGILVKLKDVDEPVPIGSMGDGIWHLLGLALAVVHARNGILLIDEIDTGLHHSVMKNMWRFLNEASKKYNVQVIATSHSRDCYQSLATICRDEVSEGSEVTISRIERGREEAVQYSEEEIIAAAEHDIEVR